MLPKSRFLFKKTVFIKIAAFLVIIPTIVVLTFTQKQPVADAQIASLYASTCLGGWKDVDKVTGVPEVAGDASVEYSESNSATLYNKQTQIYCGGFTGEIPAGVNRTRVALRFSWGVEGEVAESPKETDDNSETILEPNGQDQPVASSSDSVVDGAPSEESSDETPVVEEPQEEEVQPEEPAPAEESVSWLRHIIPYTFAQEESAQVPEVQEVIDISEPEEIAVPSQTASEEPVAEVATTSRDQESDITIEAEGEQVSATTTTSTTTASTTQSYISPIFDQNTDKDNAIFEVLFTMDNETWYPLGYVSRINNDIQFELPLELFASVEDFSKLQISLKTVERFDETPKIYLDSMWLEVSYLDIGEDPLPPPGSLGGDIITNTYQVNEYELVTTFRGVSLETISNILLLTGSSSATTTMTASSNSSEVSVTSSSTTPVTVKSVASSTASSTVRIFEAPITPDTKKILRDTPGVLVELWLHNKIEDTWMRVADNSVVGTIPRAVLIDRKVFWFGPNNSALWMFDTISQGYSSRSVSPQTPILIEYIESTGEQRTVWFNPKTEQLELMVSAI